MLSGAPNATVFESALSGGQTGVTGAISTGAVSLNNGKGGKEHSLPHLPNGKYEEEKKGGGSGGKGGLLQKKQF